MMEALGTLPGGGAYGFNNMLTDIIGLASLIRTLPLQRSEIEQRAAELTRQLLAYSQKPTLEISHVDVNFMITDLSHMRFRQ